MTPESEETVVATDLNTVTVNLANVSLHVGRPAGDDDPEHYAMTFHDEARGVLVVVGFDRSTLRQLGESIVANTSPLELPKHPKLVVPGEKLHG